MKVKFEKFYSFPKVGFWKELLYQKINNYKLDEKCKEIVGFLEGSALILNENSFTISNSDTYSKTLLNGFIKVMNTKKSFKEIDKNKLIHDIGINFFNKSPLSFQTFIILVYADIKSQSFIYWVGFPSFKLK